MFNEAGDVSVVTWNSQGDKGTETIELLNTCDILCVQERGGLPSYSHIETKSSLSVYAKDQEWNVVYWMNGGGNCRCSLAIYYKKNLFELIDCVRINPGFAVLESPQPEDEDASAGSADDPGEAEDSQSSRVRPVIGVRLKKKGGDGRSFWVYNGHLPAFNPKFARKIGYYFLTQLKRPYIWAADFNTPPDSWGIWVKTYIVASHEPTHKQGGYLTTELDYFISYMWTTSVEVYDKDLNSDHMPVCCTL